jgi:methionyl-tRNA synthetase
MTRPLILSSAIPYVNARPHLGFAYELILADALARHARARGRDVRFVTGSDEHSLNNVLAAERAGVPVAAFIAEHAEQFRALAPLLDVAPDDFVRTSVDPRHRAAALALWRACADAGDLERRSYRGRYCVGCERFYEPADLPDGRCAEHAAPLETVDEENWFFRLSRHQGALVDDLRAGRLAVEPAAARAETLAFLTGEVRDVSVSRPAARARGLGLPVPGDASQVIYVWFDALAVYLASLGWGGPDAAAYQRYWAQGERVHVLGKGIARFHTVLWPALLRSAGLPPPSRVLVHGYLTVDGEKISKSGRWVDPRPIVDDVGVDALRWYLLAHLRSGRDGDVERARLQAAHDADLADGLGNLAQRVLGLCARAGALPPDGDAADPRDAALAAEAAALPARVDDALARFAPDEAAAAIVALGRAADRHLVATAPWTALRGDAAARRRAHAVLGVALEVLRAIAAELAPFVPRAAAALRAQLASGAPGAPPFPRLAVAGPARR